MFLMLDAAIKHATDVTRIANKLLEKDKKEVSKNEDTIDNLEETTSKVLSLKQTILNMKNIKYDIKESIEEITANTKYLFGNINDQIFERNPLEFLEIYVPAFTDMLKFASEKLIPTVKNIVKKTVSYAWLILLKPIIYFIKDRINGLFNSVFHKITDIINPLAKLTNKREEAVAKSIYSTLENLSTTLGMLSAFAGGNTNKLTQILSKPIVLATAASIGGKIYASFEESKKEKVPLKDKLLSFSKRIKEKLQTSKWLTGISRGYSAFKNEFITNYEVYKKSVNKKDRKTVKPISFSFDKLRNAKEKIVTNFKSAKENLTSRLSNTKDLLQKKKINFTDKTIKAYESSISKIKSLKDKVKNIKNLNIKDVGSRIVSFFKMKKETTICDVFDSFASGLLNLLLSPFKFLSRMFGSRIKSFSLLAIRFLISFAKKTVKTIAKFASYIYTKYIRKPFRSFLFLVKKNIIRPIKNFARRFRKWIIRTSKKILELFLKGFYTFIQKTGSNFIFKSLSQLIKQTVRVILKPVISFVVKALSGLANLIPLPGIGTAISIGLFALDLKYDISGKIVDGLLNLPETISKALDSLSDIFTNIYIAIEDIVDKFISPLIDIFEFMKGLSSVIVGAAYSLTVKPILSIISNISNFFGFDSFSNTVNNINKFLLDSLDYNPTYSKDMNFYQKISYFPKLIFQPYLLMKDFITKIFTSVTGSNDEKSVQMLTQMSSNVPDLNTSAFTPTPETGQSVTIPTSNNGQANSMSSASTPMTTETNIASDVKNDVTKDVGMLNKVDVNEDNPKSLSTGRDRAFTTKPVSLKPVQDSIKIRNVIGYKLLFEQYF